MALFNQTGMQVVPSDLSPPSSSVSLPHAGVLAGGVPSQQLAGPPPPCPPVPSSHVSPPVGAPSLQFEAGQIPVCVCVRVNVKTTCSNSSTSFQRDL